MVWPLLSSRARGQLTEDDAKAFLDQLSLGDRLFKALWILSAVLMCVAVAILL